ncbi:MAG TPA: glycosyltransferase family 4 protein, partial [Candidatus Brocadiales bacterium]|nr:glycosyltransferase family 4 protein [Candidatus Brocadiales bacterium]
MKILMCHNYYQSGSPSGEDVVFRNEVALLRSKGVPVITYERHNDGIKSLLDKMNVAVKLPWQMKTYKEVRALIKKERPDLAHFHNIWYLISPSAYYACKDEGIPVVQTFHNYRFFCLNGMFMNKRRTCAYCKNRLPWMGLLDRCYRNSVLHSLPISLADGMHRVIGTFKNKIDAYIALTSTARRILVECGMDQDKIFLKPNFVMNPPEPNYNSKNYIVFLGRLSEEKGPEILIDAYKVFREITNSNISLKIIGDGPLRRKLEEKVENNNLLDVEFMGRRTFPESMKILKGAMFLALPSQWIEMFPMTCLEAFACGKAVVASTVSNLLEIITDGETGIFFEKDDFEDLAIKMKYLVENEDLNLSMGKRARVDF